MLLFKNNALGSEVKFATALAVNSMCLFDISIGGLGEFCILCLSGHYHFWYFKKSLQHTSVSLFYCLSCFLTLFIETLVILKTGV